MAMQSMTKRMKWIILSHGINTHSSLSPAGGYHLQYQRQEYIGRNLDLAHGVDPRLTCLRPEVELVAGDDAVEIEPHGLPPPEPPIADGKDDAGDSERPDEEIGAGVPAWVVGPASTVADEQEERDRVVKQCQYDLAKLGSQQYSIVHRRTGSLVVPSFASFNQAQHRLTGASGIASVQSFPYPPSQTSSQCTVMRTETANRIMARNAKKVATKRRAALRVHPGSPS